MINIRGNNISVSLDPDDGMTIVSFRYLDQELLYVDESRIQEGRTYGIPVLFPTPNRTRGGEYTFQGRRIPAVNHGFLRHSVFDVDGISNSFVSGVFRFDGTEPMFPYRGSFRITVSVKGDSLVYEASVENSGNEAFGYGLALHPFFSKRNSPSMTLNNVLRMEATDDRLPTGRTIDVRGKRDDFSSKVDVAGINEDTVYITDGAMKAHVDYTGCSMDIECSEAFNHAVVFTSPEKEFFCIEPQTCSTDAFNMAEKGFAEEAHLLTLEPGNKHMHRISFRLSR